jgi:hypothetical protein
MVLPLWLSDLKPSHRSSLLGQAVSRRSDTIPTAASCLPVPFGNCEHHATAHHWRLLGASPVRVTVLINVTHVFYPATRPSDQVVRVELSRSQAR